MTAYSIARKELREIVRDRRSLFSGLFYGVWGPLVMGMALVAVAGQQAAVGPMTIEADGTAAAPSLAAFLESRDVTVAQAQGDLAAAVRDRRIPLALVVRADYADRFEHSQPAQVVLLHDTTWSESSRRAAHLRTILTDYNRSVGETRLVLRGVAPAAMQPVRVLERDFATAGDRAGRALATMPIFVLLAAFIGGMSVAADVAAGERERGTLESLLLHPIGRLTIAGGKWLAVSSVALATVVVALATASAVMQHPRVQNLDLPIGLSPIDALNVLLVLAPLALFASALQLLIAFQARTYKEAQTKLSMMIFAPMIPGFLFAFGTLEPAGWMTFTPMIGQHVMLTELIRGDAPAPGAALGLAAVTLAAAAAAWLSAGHQLGRESVLRGNAG
jgi:sodium transport system permease protein